MTEEQNPHVGSDAIEFVDSELYEERTMLDPELEAMDVIIKTLTPLDVFAQCRVMNWVERRLRNLP